MLALSTGGKWAMAVPFYAKEPIMLENTRREFLATAAASAFTFVTASEVRSADENSKLEIGVVGLRAVVLSFETAGSEGGGGFADGAAAQLGVRSAAKRRHYRGAEYSCAGCGELVSAGASDQSGGDGRAARARRCRGLLGSLRG